MKTQKRHLIILMMFVIGLLQANTIVWAQPQPVIEYWSELEPVGPRTISTPTNVYLTGNVTLNGTITVEKGVALNIYAEGANRTIYRNFDGDMFDTQAGDGTLEGGILSFNADNRTQTITIDGGAEFPDDDARNPVQNSPNDGRTIVARGSLIMHHVIIQNIYRDCTKTTDAGNAGAIFFDSQGSKPNGDGYDVAVSDLIIRAVQAATVIYFGQDHHQFGDDDGFVRVEIYNCSSLGSLKDNWGGTIRAVGGVKSNLVLNACSIHDNIAKYGGAVFWNAGNGTSCKLRIIGDTKIYNNEATETGGGISSLSTVDLQSAEIYNNRAKNGGGLCVDTYWGGNSNYSGKGFEVKIVEGVSIHDNTATEAGGGIYMLFQPTNDVGFDAAGNPFSPQFKFEMTGGSIYNNHAPIGAGVAIVDMAPNKHRNNKWGDYAYGKWSGEYVRNVSISGGNIYDNTPESESTDTKGAGMYIAKVKAANIADGSIGYRYGDAITGGGVVTAGSITINPTGGNIYGNQANNGSGGGMYIVDEMKYVSPYFSVCNVNVGAVNIYGNTCTNNGGGLYVESGIISLNGANVSGNSTNSGNGGGIYFDAYSTMTVGTGNLKVKDNTANGVPNNIYLPTGKTIEVVSGSFNPQYLGIYTQATATASSPIPVFTVSNALNYGYLNTIYNGMRNGTMNVVDDRQIHSAQYTSPQTTLYFGIDSPWSPLQQTIKNDSYLPTPVQGVYPIGSVKDLTAFLWYVNHVTEHNEHQFDNVAHPEASAILTADIDMTGHYWMPFANYEGTFDGNGHTITGIMMVPTNVSTYTGRGLFGTTATGANIRNVTLDDCQFFAKALGECYVGSIVSDLAAGTVSNSVANPGVKLSASGNASAVLGGIAGRVSGGTLHSSIAMATMTGYTMGGLAGTNAGNIYNSFANPQFTYSGPYVTTSPTSSTDYYVGGLVATNTGQIENCYVRLERTQTLGTAHFGYLAGANHVTSGETTTNGTLTYCYAPTEPYTVAVEDGTQSYLDCYNPVIAPYKYYHSNDNTLVSDNSKNLLGELNRWVDGHSGYSPWKRTTAGGYSYTYDDGRGDVTVIGGNINGDYPIHKYADYKCVASTDGIALDYAATLDAMLSRHTSNATVNLYANDQTNSSTGPGVVVYIDEEVSLLQDVGSATPTSSITAYTGQTLKTYSTANGNRWHLFSSPLQQSQIGISYENDNQVGFSWAPNPCGVQFSADNDNALFPSDMPVSAFDLYSFYEPEYHWINFRRNSDSHWHENANEVQIHYNGNGTGGDGNETYLVPGKGYLVSINQEQLVQNKGILNNGNVTLQNVTKTDFNAWAGLLGFNLLGNPYQSYLDFEKFISQNISDDAQNTVTNADNLWSGDSEYTNTYATYDPKQKAYVQYKSGASDESNTASQYIHPHQGFFVRMTKGSENTNTTTVTYTNAMRTNEGQSGFRSGGSQPAYPLVNFTVRDSEGNADVAVLEIGRPADEGALKMRLGDCTGALSLGHEGKEYGILFRTEVEDYQPLRFEATEAGTFTLTWNTANADFERLTLVDNIAGTETDMLSRDSYRFEATSDQYASRFKVVIGDYKGVDEPEAHEPAEGPAESFAFRMGDQLVVNGAGTLQVIDMLGRVVMTERLTSSQSLVGLPKSAGVYVLRLTDGGGTRTQKIVVGL